LINQKQNVSKEEIYLLFFFANFYLLISIDLKKIIGFTTLKFFYQILLDLVD